MLNRSTRLAAIVLVALSSTHFSFAQASGADTFKAKCVMCHGEDGLGNTSVGKAMGVVSYKAPDVKKLTNAEMTTIIKNGKNKMPAFNGQLTDAQIKDVVVYIRTLQKK